MKYKGTKISGSSLLTILGVVCFATMMVAAAILLSSLTPMSGRDIADTNAMTITYQDADASVIVTDPVTTNKDPWSAATTVGTYDQGVTVASVTWAGTYDLYISVTSGAADIDTSHISIQYAKMGQTAYTPLTLVDQGTSLLDATVLDVSTKVAGVNDVYIMIITVNYAALNYVISVQAQQ